MASVRKVRTTAHHRAVGLGTRGGPRPCRYCGQEIVFVKRDGYWKPAEAQGTVQPDGSTRRELHRCKIDKVQRDRVRRGLA